ncbi:MAG: TonB-dependent siderophore receptor [Pseudomonas sp.]
MAIYRQGGVRPPERRHPSHISCIFTLIMSTLLSANAEAFESSATPSTESTARDDDENGGLALPAITVTSQSDGLSTEGTGSYTTATTTAATGLPLALRETPQSVTVVTRQRMDDQQLNSIRDVLENTTGVSSIALDSERVNYYSRGFSIDNFMYDGVPTTASGFGPAEGVLDTAAYDRVEVVRGATGLLRGVGEPSASINLVRKRPLNHFALTGTMGAGRWDNYRSMLDVSSPLTSDGRVRARLVGAYQDKKSFQDYYQQERNSLYGIVDIDLTANTTLSLGHDYQNTDPKGASWGGTPLFYSDGSRVDLPRSFGPAAQWAHWTTRSNTTFARLEQRFENGWTLKTNVDRKETKSTSHMINMGGNPDRSTGSGLQGAELDGGLNKKENSLDLMATGSFQLFGRQHELVLGGSVSREKDDSDYSYCFIPGTCAYSQPSMGSIYDWSGNYPQRPWLNRPTTTTEIRQHGLFGAARISLTDPLKLIVGARVSSYEIEENGDTQFKETNQVSPYTGLIYDLNDIYSVYASATEIFKPQQTSQRDVNGKVLSPSSGKNKEVGIKGEYFDGLMNVSLSLFEARMEGVAVQDANNVTVTTGQQAYRLVDGTQSRGIDLDAQGELAHGWNVFSGISHFTAWDQEGGRLNTTIPRTTARLFTTYRLPEGWNRLTIGGGVNWQSRWYNTATNPVHGNVQVEQASYALASLLARYQVSDRLNVSANVNNLFDRVYFTALGFQNGYIYGEPRNVMINLTYTLE